MPKITIEMVKSIDDLKKIRNGEAELYDESKYKAEGLSKKLQKHLEEHKQLHEHYKGMEREEE